MRYYIATDGKLTAFDNSPLIHETYKIGKKNVNNQAVVDVQNLLNTLCTNSNILYLHPNCKGDIGNFCTSIFTSIFLCEEMLLIDKLQRNTDNEYFIVSGIEYESYGLYINILTIDEEDYNKYIRLFIIDTFLENN